MSPNQRDIHRRAGTCDGSVCSPPKYRTSPVRTPSASRQVPVVGRNNPAINRNIDVLPAPFGPMSPRISAV
jgi:hypothetical protein